MNASTVIEFQMTRKSRRWFFIGALFMAVIAVFGASQIQGDDTAAGTVSAISLCCLVLCAFLMWRLSRRGNGRLSADADGLLIDTTMAFGRVRWDNLEKISIFKRMWQPFLGIALKDPAAFIESRAGMKGQYDLDMKLMNFGNQAATLSATKGVELAGKLIVAPQLGIDLDMLAANRKNFGFDLCLSLTGVSGAQEIPARIEALRPAGVAPAAAANEEADFKICPQCAEKVRAAAKICRFCRYSFEAEAAKA